MIIKIIFIVIIGGFIGWLTNYLAIKMLFRPIKPICIPIANITIQGLIPKRRNEISKSIGEAVENELINMTDILETLLTKESKEDAIQIVKIKILEIIDLKIPGLIPSTIKSRIKLYIGEQIDKEGIKLLESFAQDFSKKAIEKINIGKMVEDKIDEFELKKIENIIMELSARELKHIEVLGAILGAAIGLIQGIVAQFL